jgi:hypothetical protein
LANPGASPTGQQALPIDQSEGVGARDDFYGKVTGKSPEQIKAHWSKIIFTGRGQPPKTVPDGVEVKRRVAISANAIGYMDRALVDGSVKILLSVQ